MNNPEYIVVEVFEEVVSAVQSVLGLPVLNYQYGYITELNETLQQWNQATDYSSKRFPLVWLRQPFTIKRGDLAYFGEVVIDLFIINETQPTLKATERMSQNFKPVIYPIYRELITQIFQNKAIEDDYNKAHDFTDRYYWGQAQKSVLDDYVDCSEISNLRIKINNNKNC